ncbi:hypothetical protein [Halococcus sp. IIIV-5B]|uniref:hypothetical protein n=1 Tax=Halococcus sp. IIIV-5B TaxID=2321230 RepID=UPI000E74BF38|nr:hypothetical protein [Halococcus sp. IIIV-5B]RJT07583.1 hypothetical protein D3261_03035 [Halococcus sp. IIIV-5B]
MVPTFFLYYLAPVVIEAPLQFGLLLAAEVLKAPNPLLATNVGGSALDLYHAWGIANLPKGSVVYNTRYRMLVATPASEPATYSGP